MKNEEHVKTGSRPVASSIRRVGLLAVATLAACGQGCVAVQSGIHFLSVQAQYTRNGIVLRDGDRTFRYDSNKNLSTLELRDALTLEDRESDGAVDVVKAGDFSYARGEPGTAPLFADADRAMDQFCEYLSTGHFKRKWLSMDPAEIVENRIDRPYTR